MAYSRVGLRPTCVWRTLDYATTKEECTLESKSCLESVAAPTPAQNVTVSEFHAEAPQTTANEGLAHGPYRRGGKSGNRTHDLSDKRLRVYQ